MGMGRLIGRSFWGFVCSEWGFGGVGGREREKKGRGGESMVGMGGMRKRGREVGGFYGSSQG